MSMLTDFVFKQDDYQPIICNPESNWDMYANSKGRLMSIAKKPSCEDSFFGDLGYLFTIMNKGWFIDYEFFTEFGLSLVSGAHSQLMTDNKGVDFHILRRGITL